MSLTQGSLGIDLQYITYYLYHVQWDEIDHGKQNSVELITTSCFDEMLVLTYLNLKLARVHLNLKELIVFVCGYCEKHSFSGIFEKNHCLHRVL